MDCDSPKCNLGHWGNRFHGHVASPLAPSTASCIDWMLFLAIPRRWGTFEEPVWCRRADSLVLPPSGIGI